ncbi:hypothetical protein [Glycomyces dulcitolivorans]|uniref:hypothetical protein n=1 Tax=Glycomyces dulcitolivorans TaxID=2200759 RepID=UPI000DD2EC75|nr:hypothetical protein [Glycomyces dulcitolivorans]
MSTDDATGLVLGLLVIAVLVSWPALPGLRRLAPFKTFPPFRAWTARPHPDAAVAVRAGRRLGPKAGGDSAIVVVRTAWGNQDSREWRPSLRASRPLVPVVSVDGVPASWGWGTTELTLAPGEHLIAVASSHSRCYRLVNLGRGERLDLDHLSLIGDGAHRYALAGNEIRDLTYFGTRRGGFSWYYAVVIGGLVLAAGLTALMLAEPDAASYALMYGAIGIGLGIGVAAIVSSLVKQARLRHVVTAPPTIGAAPIVLDADEPARMAPAPGWAGLGLHLRYEFERYGPDTVAALAGGKPNLLQRWRTVRIGEPEAPECRPWIPAPEVLLDGRPVRAGWTRSWMQLAPGEHELTVRVPVPRSQIGPDTVVDLGEEYQVRFRAVAGETAAVALCADVAAVPAPQGPHLARFRIRLR